MIPIEGEEVRRVRPTQTHRMIGNRLEDRLELEPGAADRLNHLVRRGLLLDQLGELAAQLVQPTVRRRAGGRHRHSSLSCSRCSVGH